jgi:hypothetical protein
MTWVDDIFAAAAANNGGVVRRSLASVNQYASVDEVVEGALQRGFHVIETGDQLVVLCHTGGMTVLC